MGCAGFVKGNLRQKGLPENTCGDAAKCSALKGIDYIHGYFFF